MACDGFFTQLSGIRRGHTRLRDLGLLLFAMKLLLVEDNKKSVFQRIFLVGFFFFSLTVTIAKEFPFLYLWLKQKV